jgi:putative NADH-flavin reductase
VKLAVLGATGSELVTQALAAGHEVTAVVREQPKPGEIADRVALVLADAKSAEAVERTVAGSDAVVSALGHAKGAPDDILGRRDHERDRGSTLTCGPARSA